MRGLSWPPSGPLTPGDALEAGRVDARRWFRPPPLAASHHPGLLTPLLAAATAARGRAALMAPVTQARVRAPAALPLAGRGAPPSHRRHMLTDSQVEAFNEGRVDLPAMRGQHLLNSRQRAEDHPMAHSYQTPPAYRLDHLRIEQTRQGYPAWLGGGSCGLAARRLHPVAKGRQDSGQVILIAIRQEQRHTVP